MTTKRRTTKNTANRKAVPRNHPLVGTWKEEENPVHVSSVVYTICVVKRHFVIAAHDTEDGTPLRITNTRWDGESLRFTSAYPPTGYSAKHILRPAGKGRMTHLITSSDKTVHSRDFEDLSCYLRVTGHRTQVTHNERVSWDGKTLHFDLRFRDGTAEHHVFRILRGGRLSHEVTETVCEAWRKLPVKSAPRKESRASRVRVAGTR